MEVILKKTKITSNIIKQTNSANVSDLKTFEVLGWCNYKVGKHTHKYILLYKSATQELRVYLYFRDLKEVYINDDRGRDYYTPEKFNLETKTPNYVDKVYTFLKEDERDNFKKLLLEIKHQADIKGQIYV